MKAKILLIEDDPASQKFVEYLLGSAGHTVVSASDGEASGTRLADTPGRERAKPTEAEVRNSVRPDGLISFEDGRVYKTLRRHLNKLGLTPSQYRAKWGLPHDYPLVAPNLSEFRSAMARQKQLGHLAKSESPSPTPKEGRRSRAAVAR